MRENKKFQQKIVALLCFLLCFLTSCNFQKKPASSEKYRSASEKEIDDTRSEETKDSTENVSDGTDTESFKEKKDGTTNLDTKHSKEQKTEISKTQTKSYSHTTRNVNPFATWNGNDTDTQYWTKLQAVAQSAGAFYQGYAESAGLYSRGGKMYHPVAREYVNATYLCNHAGMDKQYIDFQCDVLLLKGRDLVGYSGLNVPASSMNFGVFTAVKQPQDNDIMIATSEGKVGVISASDYQNLLASYSQQHGAINRMLPGTGEYERILNFIRVYDGRYDKYYVRGVSRDDKYAVVTLSPQENPINVKQYILVYDNSFWEVAMSGLEKEYNLKKAVNQKLPDFNLNLLPNYNLAATKNDMKADYSDVKKMLIYNSYIDNPTQISYLCGTTKFVYVVLYDGTKFLAVRKQDTWKIEKVNSYYAALNTMKANGGERYVFILWEE